MWEGKGEGNSIHKEKWPDYDKNLIKEETFQLIVQVNGKHRSTIEAEIGINQRRAEELTMLEGRVRNFLEEKKIKKVIFVPNRLINFVTELK